MNKHPMELISSHFGGCVLACPAIEVSRPAPIVKTILDWLVVPFFPDSSIPESWTSVSNKKAVWSQDLYVEYVTADEYPENPTGLGWGNTMRYQTASTMYDLVDRVQAALEHVEFPFLVMHDPEDSICKNVGSTRLIAVSKTLETDKLYIPIEGGLHDLFANKLSKTTETSINWVLHRVGAM